MVYFKITKLQNIYCSKNCLKRHVLISRDFILHNCKGGSFHKCSAAALPTCPELLLNILPLSSSNKLDLRLHKDLHLMDRRITDEGHEWL